MLVSIDFKERMYIYRGFAELVILILCSPVFSTYNFIIYHHPKDGGIVFIVVECCDAGAPLTYIFGGRVMCNLWYMTGLKTYEQ